MKLVAEQQERLDRFLARVLPQHSRSRLSEWIQEGKVLVGGKPRKPSFLLEPGLVVELDEPAERKPHDLTPMALELDVRYEDEHLLVVNKPRGLATHPAPTLKGPSLVNALLARGQELSKGSESFRPGIVHRLDKETTGLIIVAKTDRAHASLAKQIADKVAVRGYLAVVAGSVARERFDIDAPLGRDPGNRQRMAVVPDGKPALTHVRRVGDTEAGTLLVVKLSTGRTHQIRVHLAAIGNPVIGDALYAPPEYRGGPLQLHAAFVCFSHPVTGDRIQVFAEAPEDLLARDLCNATALDLWL